jgi:hypothetical protein
LTVINTPAKQPERYEQALQEKGKIVMPTK